MLSASMQLYKETDNNLNFLESTYTKSDILYSYALCFYKTEIGNFRFKKWRFSSITKYT
jgi:hypothetical protein